MRSGRFQPKGGEDATIRNAEALFETRTVLEIRGVEARTRKEIEEKKEELRQLVGASYRDLIESADSIVLMKKSCEAVAYNIRRMEDGFESLKQAVAFTQTSPDADVEGGRRERLYGIGSRVKYLVDTPEKIWGCLDEHMYLEGSERYLRAREVHSLLTETSEVAEKKELLANFPLLRHQWPLVETFRGQISQRSRDRLQESGLDVADYAVALAAVAIIDELTSQQAFTLFLETRKSWLRTLLRGAVSSRDRIGREKTGDGGESGNGKSTAAALRKVVFLIQASLCQVGELFLEVSNGKAPLLFSTVLTAPPGSQLFGGIPNPEKEVRLWKAHREKLESSMGALSGKYITEACVPWLHSCAEEIRVEGKALLDEIKSVTELVDIEKGIREDLAAQAALGPSLDWLKSAFGRHIDSPWDCICQLLLKEPVNLWDGVFESMFVERVKGILDAGFSELSVGPLLNDCLDAVKASPSALEDLTAGQLYSSDAARLGPSGGGPKRLERIHALEDATGSLWKCSRNVQDLFGAMDSCFGPDVARVKDSLDVALKRILEDLLGFLQGPRGSLRTSELAPHLQERCQQCVSNIVSDLEAKITSLSKSMATATGSMRESPRSVNSKTETWPSKSNNESPSHIPDSNTEQPTLVEKALFLGRIADALRLHSSSLPLLLGPPSLWVSRESRKVAGPDKGTFLARRNSWLDSQHPGIDGTGRWRPGTSISGDEEATSKLAGLQRSLRRLSIASHSTWVTWSTQQLSACLSRDILKDECLSTVHPLKGWEETVLKQQDEGGGMVELKMALPAMPSPYTVAFLFSACQEIRRVGGHLLDKAVLRMFAWKVSEHIFATYENLISDSSAVNSRISEKGLLQLLFDVRLLSDVLSGGQDITVENFDSLEEEKSQEPLTTGPVLRRKHFLSQSEAASSARKKWALKITLKLCSRLDPIDWATYEPHLWENERRFYQRSAVLFGALIQLNRLYTDTGQRLPSTSDTNVLNMSATVPRFTYLPISAPNLSANGLSTPLRSRRKDDSGWRSNVNGEDASKFTFEDSPSSASSSKPLLKSIMGQVGSKFGEGTLKLGSMLSDGQVGRFKDKSALAISTFGDMYAAGLFSSLTASATKSEG